MGVVLDEQRLAPLRLSKSVLQLVHLLRIQFHCEIAANKFVNIRLCFLVLPLLFEHRFVPDAGLQDVYLEHGVHGLERDVRQHDHRDVLAQLDLSLIHI